MARRKGTSDSLWRELIDRTDAGRETVRRQFNVPPFNELRVRFPKIEADRAGWECSRQGGAPGGADAALLVCWFSARGMIRVVCNALGC